MNNPFQRKPMKARSSQIVLGHVVDVSIPSLGISRIIAKVDTGAFTGALHCTDIRLDETGRELSFNPLGRKGLRTTTNEFQELKVRSASGHQTNRFLIPIQLEIDGVTYNTNIGLSDRKDMGREMLIGRRFLRQNNMLVDVTMNGDQDEEWKRVNI